MATGRLVRCTLRQERARERSGLGRIEFTALGMLSAQLTCYARCLPCNFIPARLGSLRARLGSFWRLEVFWLTRYSPTRSVEIDLNRLDGIRVCACFNNAVLVVQWKISYNLSSIFMQTSTHCVRWFGSPTQNFWRKLIEPEYNKIICGCCFSIHVGVIHQ